MVQDEVFAVLHLGVDGETMSYDDAIVVNKLILNMRIQHLYEQAVESPKYKSSGYWNEEYVAKAYWRTNYAEFWAEASAAYLVAEYLKEWVTPRLPPRAWIKENDPALFSLLEEVYSMAPLFAGT